MLFASPRGIVSNLNNVNLRGVGACRRTTTIFGWLSWACWIYTRRLGERVLLVVIALLKPRSLSWSTSLARASGNCTSFLDSPFFLLVYPPLLLVHATMTLLARKGLTHCHVSCLWHRLAMSLFHFDLFVVLSGVCLCLDTCKTHTITSSCLTVNSLSWENKLLKRGQSRKDTPCTIVSVGRRSNGCFCSNNCI